VLIDYTKLKTKVSYFLDYSNEKECFIKKGLKKLKYFYLVLLFTRKNDLQLVIKKINENKAGHKLNRKRTFAKLFIHGT